MCGEDETTPSLNPLWMGWADAAIEAPSEGPIPKEWPSVASMKALLNTMLAEKASSRRSRKRKRCTRYVDIEDLRKHFKGKPDQYYTVKNAGPEFTCTHTGTAMYAIHTFTQDNPHSHLAMFN